MPQDTSLQIASDTYLNYFEDKRDVNCEVAEDAGHLSPTVPDLCRHSTGKHKIQAQRSRCSGMTNRQGSDKSHLVTLEHQGP